MGCISSTQYKLLMSFLLTTSSLEVHRRHLIQKKNGKNPHSKIPHSQWKVTKFNEITALMDISE